MVPESIIKFKLVLEAIEEYLNKPKGTLYCYTKTLGTRFPAFKNCTINFFNGKEVIFSVQQCAKTDEVDDCYAELYKKGIVQLLNYFKDETSKD